MVTLLLILIPFLTSMVLLFARQERVIRLLALAGSLVAFGVSIWAYIQFKYLCKCVLLFDIPWIDTLGFRFHLDLDGISLLLVLMTTILVPLILLSTWKHRIARPASFYSLILLMQSAMLGVFAARDGLLFYVFWEMALIPAWFITALWGGADRIRITFKFFAYTFTGSLFMLVALVWLYFRTPLPHSFDIWSLYFATITPAEQAWVFAAFFLAFAIKMPVFPFHTWQPDTYTTAPAAGTMLLAGIMLKMGIYGMIRWIIPIAPQALEQYGPVVITLALTGLVYASLIAIRQKDLKRLIAYSSIAHVGLIAAGIATMSEVALQGSMIQMLSHGINVVGLFIIIDIIENRTGTRLIANLGGIARQAPRLAIVFMIVMLGSIALPLTNGFIGEFLLLLGLFRYDVVYAVVGGLTLILGAVYMLWVYQRVMYRQTDGPAVKDLTGIEMAALTPVVVMILWIGIYPQTFLSVSKPAVELILGMIK